MLAHQWVAGDCLCPADLQLLSFTTMLIHAADVFNMASFCFSGSKVSQACCGKVETFSLFSRRRLCHIYNCKVKFEKCRCEKGDQWKKKLP